MVSTATGIDFLARQALDAAKTRHDTLGAAGEESVQKNRFGDTALRCDIEAEDAVLDVLRQANAPIAVVSEEHGRVNLCETPSYLGLLDGIDGSGNYKKGRMTLRYGTILGIFEGANPRYDDYLFSGFIEPATGRLFYAVRGKGAYLVENGEERRIQTSGATLFDEKTSIWADTNSDKVLGITVIQEAFVDRLPGYTLACANCSGAYYADVASGAKDLALEFTRKGNLELAGLYGLIRESGGAMVDIDGNSLGPQRYLSFGQDRHIPIITAATDALAASVVAKLKR